MVGVVKKGRGDLALGAPAASLAESDPLGISTSLGLGGMAGAGGIQPGGLALFSCCCTWGKRASLQDFKGWQQVGTWRADVLKSHYLLLSLLGASCWPCPVPPHPCAMAGWGSWGWDLLPVTNHIARDFQPTLSPASGATAVTASAEDTDPGMGMGWQRGLHRLRLAWGAGLSCL